MNTTYQWMSRAFLVLILALLVPMNGISNEQTNGPRVHIREGTSANWAGYAAQTSLASPKSDAVTNVKAAWIIPAVDCVATPSTYSSQWIGIDGYTSNTVEQI